MVDFFQCIQTWEVKGSTVKYVKPLALPSDISDDLVTKLEGSLSILYHLVRNAESGTMHLVWQNAVSSNHDFPVDNGDLTIEGTAMQGFHLPDCFKRRLWLCLQHIYLGFVLYKIISKSVLLSKEVYKNDTSMECPEWSSYVSLLAHTCLVFKNVEDVSSLQDDFLIGQCLAKPDVNLSKKMEIQFFSMDDDTEAHIIYNSFTSLTNNTSRLKHVSYQSDRNSVAFKFQAAGGSELENGQTFIRCFQIKEAKSSTRISSSQSSFPLPQDTADTATIQPLAPLPDIHREELSLLPNVPPLAIEQVSLEVIVSSLAVISGLIISPAYYWQ
eukprot:jgi/Psemu1/38009/gm1.38009_g